MDGFDFFTYDRKTLFNVVFLKAGEPIPAHLHDYPHDCFILQGTVRVGVGSVVQDLPAPSTIHFPTGAIHGWEAVTDAIVLCTHPADKVVA